MSVSSGFPFNNDGSTVTGDGTHVLLPSAEGWKKLSIRIVSGSGTINVQENGITLDDWSAVTASQQKLIWVTPNVPINVVVSASSSLVLNVVAGFGS